MNAFLIAFALYLQPPIEDAAKPKIDVDGTWRIEAVERDGSTEETAADVVIKDNVLSPKNAESAPGAAVRRLRLDFGPNGTIVVVESNVDGTFVQAPPGLPTDRWKSGVYVLTDDYLAISVREAPSAAIGVPNPAQVVKSVKGTYRIVLKRAK